MKTIQSVLVMSRQNSGYFGKDIPYLDFDSEIQHEASTSEFREIAAMPGLSMMDWTERLIELTTVNDDGQDPQETVDQMTLITLNVAVTSATDTTSELSGALNSDNLDCWQADTLSHRRNSLGVSGDLNIPVSVQTLFIAGGDENVYHGRSQSSSGALLFENAATGGVHAYDIPFSHSAGHISQHSEGGASNNPHTFHSESLSETLDMYGISKEDLRADLDFHDKITPPVSSAPLVTLSMLLEEDTLCESNKGFNLSTPVSSYTCLHTNTRQHSGDKSSRTLTTDQVSRHQKQSSYVHPISTNLPVQNLNLSKNRPNSFIDSQSEQRTSASSYKVNSSLCQLSETSSNIIALSPDFTRCNTQVNFTVSQDKKTASELCPTPDVKSLPNWEPIFLSLTDMDIQSEIEVVENRITDFDALNTPTDIPKDALEHHIESTKKQSLSERHLLRQPSHLQKTASTLIHTNDHADKPIHSSGGSFFSFNVDNIDTFKSQTSQSKDNFSFSITETLNQSIAHASENTSAIAQDQKQSQILFQNMAKKQVHIQNVDNNNCSYVNSFPSTSFSKPVLSELSSDALLSPGDVDKAFLGCLSTKSYSAQVYSSLDGNTSDISSSISSSLPEVDNQEQASFSGENLKIKLRSRLKAKGTALVSPAVNLSIETSGSSSTTDNQMSSIASKSSPRNTYTLKRKSSSDNSSEASKAKNVFVSSSSNVSESGSSDEEDDITSYFATSEAQRRKQLSSRRQEEEEEDEETKLAKREKNRIAAQKCRHKKTDKIESLTRQVQRLENRQDRIKTEVEKLNEEREQLEEMLRVHSFVCQRGNHSNSHKH